MIRISFVEDDDEDVEPETHEEEEVGKSKKETPKILYGVVEPHGPD